MLALIMARARGIVLDCGELRVNGGFLRIVRLHADVTFYIMPNCTISTCVMVLRGACSRNRRNKPGIETR